MKNRLGILSALLGLALLAGASLPAFAADKPASVPSTAKFMQDSEDCKEIAFRPDSNGVPPGVEARTSTYMHCMTARGYAEDDVKTRTRDSSIDFTAVPPPPPSMAPPGIPAAK